MGFPLVFAVLLGSAAALAIITVIVLRQAAADLVLRRHLLTSASTSGMSLVWWVFVTVWWAGVVSPEATRNVQLLTYLSPLVYVLLVLGTVISLNDLFEAVGHAPKGGKSLAVILGLGLAGFLITRRWTVSVLLVAFVGVLLIAALLALGRKSHWVPQLILGLAFAALIVYVTAMLASGWVYDLKPIVPVPADQDEVFYRTSIKTHGWYYFWTAVIVGGVFLFGVLTGNARAAVAFGFLGYLLYATYLVLAYATNAVGLIYALLGDLFGGVDIMDWWIAIVEGWFGPLTAESEAFWRSFANPRIYDPALAETDLPLGEDGYPIVTDPRSWLPFLLVLATMLATESPHSSPHIHTRDTPVSRCPRRGTSEPPSVCTSKSTPTNQSDR